MCNRRLGLEEHSAKCLLLAIEVVCFEMGRKAEKEENRVGVFCALLEVSVYKAIN